MVEAKPKKLPFHSAGCACYKCGGHITGQRARRGLWSVGGHPFCSRPCAQWLADEVNRLRRIKEQRGH